MLPIIEVCPVALPGRGRRFSEPPFTRMEPLVEHLATALTPYLDRPYAFYGHSMGALICYELARELRRRGTDLPVHLFVAAQRSPDQIRKEVEIHRLPDQEFLEHLKSYGGIPQEMIYDAELMEVLMPQLRADFAICETYRYDPEPPLTCRITALGGLSDGINREELQAWEQHTTERFRLHMFPGGHFFLREQEIHLIQLIARQLDVGSRGNTDGK